MSDVVVKQFTFAISSPYELLVDCAKIASRHCRNGDNFKTPVDNLIYLAEVDNNFVLQCGQYIQDTI